MTSLRDSLTHLAADPALESREGANYELTPPGFFPHTDILTEGWREEGCSKPWASSYAGMEISRRGKDKRNSSICPCMLTQALAGKGK